MILTSQKIHKFQETIYKYYRNNKREFAWRKTQEPYNIVVSEIMLQQTQTKRVVEKYEEFIALFPNFQTLAKAELKDVLLVWIGLGYNRRAKYLHNLAKIVIDNYNGSLPKDYNLLLSLPGIGKGTAGSIRAFAFNKPEVFIETNIRSVFIHYFFTNKDNIHDNDIYPLVKKTLDKKNPRDWYFALMDYGSMLKSKYKNPSQRSTHYTTQSPFTGSRRQKRAAILKYILQNKKRNSETLSKKLNISKKEVVSIIKELTKEKLL